MKHQPDKLLETESNKVSSVGNVLAVQHYTILKIGLDDVVGLEEVMRENSTVYCTVQMVIRALSMASLLSLNARHADQKINNHAQKPYPNYNLNDSDEMESQPEPPFLQQCLPISSRTFLCLHHFLLDLSVLLVVA